MIVSKYVSLPKDLKCKVCKKECDGTIFFPKQLCPECFDQFVDKYYGPEILKPKVSLVDLKIPLTQRTKWCQNLKDFIIERALQNLETLVI